jgi:hypothetical protein
LRRIGAPGVQQRVGVLAAVVWGSQASMYIHLVKRVITVLRLAGFSALPDFNLRDTI